MLVHEIPEGSWAKIDNILFIRAEDCIATRVPGWAEAYYEADGTLTLMHPMVVTNKAGKSLHLFVMHDRFFTLAVATR